MRTISIRLDDLPTDGGASVARAAQRLIVDAGPLIGWFDANDAYDAMVRGFFDGYTGELLSTWPVLSEVCHLLPEHPSTWWRTSCDG